MSAIRSEHHESTLYVVKSGLKWRNTSSMPIYLIVSHYGRAMTIYTYLISTMPGQTAKSGIMPRNME